MADPFAIAGPIVSAGIGLIGSKMAADATNRAARLNAMYQAGQNQMDRDIAKHNNDLAWSQWATNRQDAQTNFSIQLQQAEKDRALQREFAQNGIQWRANDARAAGLHPLAALGAQLASSTPISISGGGGGGTSSFSSPTSTPGSPFAGASMGSGISAMGQDIGRAIAAASPESARVAQVAETQTALQLQNMKLQNELLASQIAKTSGASIGPSMPTATMRKMIDGQGNTPTKNGRIKNNLVEEKKHEPVVGHPTQKHSEPGEVTDLGYAKTKHGYTPVPSKDVKERIEDSFLSEIMWEIRNRVPQTFGFNLSPPAHVSPKKGDRWWYSPLMQEYQTYTPKSAPGKTGAVRNRNYMRIN